MIENTTKGKINAKLTYLIKHVMIENTTKGKINAKLTSLQTCNIDRPNLSCFEKLCIVKNLGNVQPLITINF